MLRVMWHRDCPARLSRPRGAFDFANILRQQRGLVPMNVEAGHPLRRCAPNNTSGLLHTQTELRSRASRPHQLPRRMHSSSATPSVKASNMDVQLFVYDLSRVGMSALSTLHTD
jgi:hypothetical protein